MNGPKLDTTLRELGWGNSRQLRNLEGLELRTVGDLLHHYPRRHEDRTHFDRFPTEEMETAVCVTGEVMKTSMRRFGGWKRMFEAVLVEEDQNAFSSLLVCRWFNLSYIQKLIATGQRLVVYGKPRRKGKQIHLDHPEFEVIEQDEEALIHLKRIVPIHPAGGGVSTRFVRSLVYRALEEVDRKDVTQVLPEGIDGMTRFEALQGIHFPESFEQRDAARRHLVLAEFFLMQLLIASRRSKLETRPGRSHAGDGRLADSLRRSLKFELTGAQKRAIGEVLADLSSEKPMNRLLQGDVGSGKTIVALSAMLHAVEGGYQAALMAPTQILAEQHYLNFTRLLSGLGVRVALCTGARREDSALPLFEEMSGGCNEEAGIIVGTHALLYDRVRFSNLGLVVIDEQHKFGVLQRARLIEQGVDADVLVMTATPIPRTLTMTLYGDLDISVIDEMPANRQPIVTGIRDESKLPEAVGFIRKQLDAGRQAYIVYPLIEESEKLQVKAATQEHEKWMELLAPWKCELLHGRVAPEEKEAIMSRFRDGAVAALVSTTVIEVGIDVPNANLMLVENAERFGLAQLHQLRGRIGRGKHRSYCILLTGPGASEAKEKLGILEETSDGFKIAEADLRLRGPGDMLGTAQSGLPPLRIGDLISDAGLMSQAQRVARGIFERDKRLSRPENRRYREMITRQSKRILAQVS